jgi:acetolactate synthase-1/3 small subunit
MQLVDVYRARIVDVSPETLVIESTGTEDKIDSLLEVLRPYGVIEMVRTGRIEMAHLTAAHKVSDKLKPLTIPHI